MRKPHVVHPTGQRGTYVELQSVQQLIDYLKQHHQTLYVPRGHNGEIVLNNAWKWDFEAKRFRIPFAMANDDAGKTAGFPSPLEAFDSPFQVTVELLEELQKEIVNPDSELAKHAASVVNRFFLYFDVSDFTRYPPSQQLLIVKAIAQIVDDPAMKDRFSLSLASFTHYETRLSIGDGYIFVLNDVVSALWFAVTLAVEVQTRTAKKTMPVDFHLPARSA